MKWLHIAGLVCVAVTSAYLIFLSNWLVHTLAERDWCYTAIGAEKAAPGSNLDALTACVGLLTLQVKALALDSHIAIGTLALCLAVLVVVVIANAHVSGKAGPTGVEGTIGGAAEGAQAATDAAKEAGQQVVDEIKEGVSP